MVVRDGPRRPSGVNAACGAADEGCSDGEASMVAEGDGGLYYRRARRVGGRVDESSQAYVRNFVTALFVGYAPRSRSDCADT